ncbi:MAG TPA: tryptophan-rich sensory protein [Methanoregula sp.]|nr:tryptophan-rich sensory protein [Methanoregula sp.]
MTGGHHTGKLIVSLVTCLLPGYIALYLFTTSIPGWYSNLNKPDFVPPDIIVFYTIIFAFSLLGLTMYSIWNAGLLHRDVKAAFQMFLFVLILFFFWFVAFFYIQSVFFALIVMIMTIAVMLCVLVQALLSTVGSALFIVPSLILMLVFCCANLMILLMNSNLPFG